MSELIIINDIFDQLKHENNRLLNELLFAQKNIELLENFRVFSLKDCSKCVCDKSIENKKQWNRLENNYLVFKTSKINYEYSLKDNKVIVNTNISKSDSTINEIRGKTNSKQNVLIQSSDEDISESFDTNINEINTESSDESIDEHMPEKSLNRKITKKLIEMKDQISNRDDCIVNSFVCQWIGCGIIFDNLRQLKVHERVHTLNTSNTSRNSILNIIRSDEIQTEQVCENIKVFRKKSEKTGFGCIIGYGCDWTDCEYVAKDKAKVINHIDRKHTSEKTIICLKCDFDDCNYVTKNKNYFKKHIMRHKGEKPFACDYVGCNFRAVVKYDVTEHQKTHSNDRPYVCDWPGCESAFKVHKYLFRHKLTHSDTGEKRFSCDWPGCEKSFNNVSVFKSHKNSHLGLKKTYLCSWPECGRDFSNITSFKDHKDTHLGVKKYPCSWPGCDRKFPSNNCLSSHLKVHSGVKDVKCKAEGCDKRFTLRSNMNKHYKSAHFK